MIKGVIFDLDGVLVCTDKLHYQAWKKIADKEGIYFDEEINNRLRGVSRMESLDIVLSNSTKKYTVEEKEKLAEEKNQYYVNSLASLDRSYLLDNVLKTLLILRKNNIRLAIGSASKNTRRILIQLQIIDYFDVVVDGNMVENPKPNPEVFTKAKELLNIENDKLLVVEDACSGVEASKNAGIRVCGIKEASKHKLCDFPIKNIFELIDIIKREFSDK